MENDEPLKIFIFLRKKKKPLCILLIWTNVGLIHYKIFNAQLKSSENFVTNGAEDVDRNPNNLLSTYQR